MAVALVKFGRSNRAMLCRKSERETGFGRLFRLGLLVNMFILKTLYVLFMFYSLMVYPSINVQYLLMPLA